MSSSSTTLSYASAMRPCFDFGHFAIRNTFTIVDAPQQQIQSSLSNDDLARMRGWFKSEHQFQQQQQHSIPHKTEAVESSSNTSMVKAESRDCSSTNSVTTSIKFSGVNNKASTSTEDAPDADFSAGTSSLNKTHPSKIEQLKDNMRNYQKSNLKRAKSWDVPDSLGDKSPIMRKKSDPMFCSSSLPLSIKERRTSSWTEGSYQLAKTESLPQIDIQTGLWNANRNIVKPIKRDSFDENEEEDTTVTSSVQCDSTTKCNIPTSKKGSGQIHLYAFLLSLLEDVENDDKDICWIDRSRREFKLVSPNRVATKWGCVKHKPNMTYEKMSRALRYYYRKEIIEKVREHQYVYRFTDKVHMSLNT